MNPSRSSSLLLLLLVLLGLPVLADSKRQNVQGKLDKPRQPPSTPAPTSPAKRPRNRSVPGSGELSTKEGHRCTWRTSGDSLVTLLVNCSIDTQGEQQRYWCRYAGKPDLCQAYGVKSSQYWKQLVGKLKKRPNACNGERVLKAKTCKKAPADAHMKLAQRSSNEEKKGGGKRKGVSAAKNQEGGKTEKRKKNEEEEKKKSEERMVSEGEGLKDEEEGLMNDMQPVQSYCGEGWSAVCSFFVKFFEG